MRHSYMSVVEGHSSHRCLDFSEEDPFASKHLTICHVTNATCHRELMSVGGDYGMAGEYTQTTTNDATVCVCVCEFSLS